MARSAETATAAREGARHPAWIVFALLLAVQTAICLAVALSGAKLLDYNAYHLAAERLAAGGDPYGDPALVQETFAKFARFLADPARDPAALEGPTQPAYIYPPTLASLMAASGALDTPLVQVAFILASAGAIALTSVILMAAVPEASRWLVLLPVAGQDLVFQFAAGNAEVIAFALTLAGCAALAHGRPLLAALPLACAVLLKPVFGPLIAAFALIRLWQAADRLGEAGRIACAATLSLALVGAEIWRWPPDLVAHVGDWLADPLAYTFLALPVEAQAPYSDWNRAPAQFLVTLGLAPASAIALAPVIAAALLALALACLPRRDTGLVPAFALAALLAIVARPTVWSVMFLDLALLLALHPVLSRRAWRLAVGLAVALALARWAGFLLAIAGGSSGLLGLQTAALPFETVVLLPLGLAAALLAMRARAALDARARGPYHA